MPHSPSLRRRRTQGSQSQSQESEDSDALGHRAPAGPQSLFTYPNYGNGSHVNTVAGPPYPMSLNGLGPDWHWPMGHAAQTTAGMPAVSVGQQPMPPPHSRDQRPSDASSNTLYESRNPGASPHASLSYSTYSAGSDFSKASCSANTWPGHFLPYGASLELDGERPRGHVEDIEKVTTELSRLPKRRRGYLANLIDLYNLYDNTNDNDFVIKKLNSATRAANARNRLVDPLAYNEDQLLDQDDPLFTGVKKKCLDDMDDVFQDAKRQLSYKERREEQQRVRIEFNICSIEIRQTFLMTFARALLSFGAPSHRMESQLLAAARILEVDAEFTHMPGIIIASFGDEETKSSQMHFAKCPGHVSLGKMHKLHKIYRAVVHDELSAKKATEQLEEMLKSGPMCPVWLRGIFFFCIGGLICPLAFGGSFVDMWLGGASSLFLFSIQAGIASRKSVIYANVYEILSVIAVSFLARGLSTIRSQIFCYAAISSAGVVTVLPGYLILTSSLDLATKNIMCGSIKLVYALIYTLFLGFALQFGSDLYLLFDPSARLELDTLAARAAAAITITGNYITDNSTQLNPRIPHMVKACYRPPDFPWYLQPYPFWAQFVIVPIFSFISSFNNEQPITLDLFVMVFISIVSYAANKVADHFIFNRSDVVSAIGAFVVGLLGNIYSRKMRGTAFTVMVTGVLFLVPSGLSEAGGITAQNSATQIGAAMVSVTIGITVGLFSSHALVYLFGSNKNAASFSF